MSLNLSHSDHDGYALIAVAGDLDLATAPELAALGEQVVTAGAANVVVDANELAFCDSSGLRVLVQIANDLHPGGGKLVIAGAKPIVLRVLEITGLTDTVVLADSVPEAAAAL